MRQGGASDGTVCDRHPFQLRRPRGCPPSDATPRPLLLSKTVTDVLVPGDPSSALIRRYWGRSGGVPEPEDERAGIPKANTGTLSTLSRKRATWCART